MADWLEKNGYHPRSDKHGDALCSFFLDDLLYSSKAIRQAAMDGKIVYKQNYLVGKGTQLEWNVDLVLGPPIVKPIAVQQGKIVESVPKEIWMAVDAKSVMTEHGKARRNRQRDLNSFASIMKHHYPRSVVGGMVVVNIAEQFRSPLRPNVTKHNNIERLVGETVQLFRQIPRNLEESGVNIEGVAAIVVDHTNISGDKTKLITRPPAPQKEDNEYYGKFLEIMEETFERRYLSK
ncbi:hypothetical protein MUP77_17110 [Candidatus Bathyarchaeota archaeon]|nr:hypothetical protein [Candidatus Bathyarchaeota archaeon]